jgi:thiamine kinase-like enzyme
MLDTAVGMVYNPGSNLKGQVAGANWSFLLPDMNLERILCFGKPSLRTQEILNHLSREVLIITEEPNTSLFQHQNQDHSVDLTHRDPQANFVPASLSNDTFDLLLLIGRKIIRKFHSNLILQSDLIRRLRPHGLIYLELEGLFEQLLTQKEAKQLASNLGTSHFLWSSPIKGEIRAAIPVDDRITISYFIHHGLYQSESKTNYLTKARRFIFEPFIQNKSTQRQVIFISHDNSVEMGSPPEYLQTLASQAGIDIQQYRWGLAAHGEYSTRKVLFYLFKSEDESPEYIVKLVRNSAYNSRLENEYHALSTLWGKGVGALNFLPKPVFFGYHNNLAILGETAIAGKSFRTMTGNHPDCTYTRLAVQHLTELGVEFLDPYSTTPGKAAETLNRLFESFIRIYQPNSKVQTFLEKQIVSIASYEGFFPLVFQHGDPGTWNILVTSKGDVFFLDWESAERNGVPLWDLFYFLRSYAVGFARKAGIRDAVRGFEQQFLFDKQFSHFTIEALYNYCQRLKLPVVLVEPLFYTCWMHRSLKEANRLAQNQLYKSHYFNLLISCIEKRDTLQMSHLFSAGF